MIRFAENIEGLGGCSSPLSQNFRRLFIEIASDKDVDVAVVTEEQLRAFQESESGDDVAIDWIEQVRQYDFECRLLPRGKQYLLIWNSYQDEPVNVAYKITGVEEYAPPYPGDVRVPGQPAPQPAS
ncbi:MAG: hypothetical protein L0241_25680 [Planctomycetia bacterium]|nr:hypothetical protein [Planctomycetia bacterium]